MITNAQKRALVAVHQGEVVRVYMADKNILRGPKGISSSTLWRLDTMKLIGDGENYWGEIERTCRQILTPKGQALYESMP
jgi:hypothetical protein